MNAKQLIKRLTEDDVDSPESVMADFASSLHVYEIHVDLGMGEGFSVYMQLPVTPPTGTAYSETVAPPVRGNIIGAAMESGYLSHEEAEMVDYVYYIDPAEPGLELTPDCECDNTHARNGTVCQRCWARQHL